jgi:hypothetical protein
MKHAPLLVTSALALAAAIGLFISHQQKSAVEQAAAPVVATSWQKVVAAVRPVTAAPLEKAWTAVSQAVSRVTGERLVRGGLKLREPVVIVTGAKAGSSLQAGTAVAFVSNEGRYMRVQHQHEVLTVPRSAVERIN